MSLDGGAKDWESFCSGSVATGLSIMTRRAEVHHFVRTGFSSNDCKHSLFADDCILF